MVEEPDGDLLDLGLTEPPSPEPAASGPGDGSGFAFQATRIREPIHWAAVLRIGLIVTFVAAMLAASLYYLGYLIKAQLDRVLGS